MSDPVEQTSLSVTVPTAATTGESVNLSATVSPSNAQGTVQFKIDGMTVGSPQTVSGGAASLPYTFDASGSFAVIAEFTGATGFTNSSAQAQNVTVTAPVVPDTDTTTTVTAPVTAVTGQQMTLSVAVSPVPTGGTVQFTVAGTDVGAPVPWTVVVRRAFRPLRCVRFVRGVGRVFRHNRFRWLDRIGADRDSHGSGAGRCRDVDVGRCSGVGDDGCARRRCR
ncbi:hypothetical protein GS887_24855 [Rhodococcus hoagii]|nr:hypothetical protein [Prescottella equi]